MNKIDDTEIRLREASNRILAGETMRIPSDRKLSISAIEAEAGLSNGSAYYYPDFIKDQKRKIKQLRTEQGAKPKSVSQRADDEKRIKENYRGQVLQLREQLSKMASAQHETMDALTRALYEIEKLRGDLAKKLREEMTVVKLPTNKEASPNKKEFYHFGINVAVLSWPQPQLDNFLEWLKKMSPEQFGDIEGFLRLLQEAAALGHSVIPIGLCSNWDFHKGCGGHEKGDLSSA